MDLVTLDDIQTAAQRIVGVAVRTPLLTSVTLGTGLWLKPESLQPTGAFKIRGAVNAVFALSPEVRARGVVTHSSGNHGQALAYAARVAGTSCTVVVPSTAPAVKVGAIRSLGAEIVVAQPPERLNEAQRIADERGASLIPPFDHHDVIAGQGTIALEILADLPEVEVIVTPVGGGGLVSGVATAVKAIRPGVRVIGVEPELAGETAESLHRGELVTWPVEETYKTIADGVRTNPSPLTFAHIQSYVDDIVTVPEERIREAVGVLANRGRLVVEPSGALPMAAYLQGVLPSGPTALVLTGGNLEPADLRSMI